jgi:acyl carrier protein
MDGGIAQKVIAIIAAQALIPPGEIALDDTVETLGLDSLGLVEAIFAIEEAYDITVPFNAAAAGEKPDFDTTNVGTIIAAVTALVAQKSA